MNKTVDDIVAALIKAILTTEDKVAVRQMVEMGNIKPARSWYRQW